MGTGEPYAGGSGEEWGRGVRERERGVREREQGRQPLRLAADKPPSRAGERTAVFVDKLTKMRRLPQSCCRHSSDNRTASRAVETALSSPQSQHVRRCVPRGLTARLASPLPTHLLRICAGALKRHGQCAVSKFAGGQSHTVALPRKRLLTPREGAYHVEFSDQGSACSLPKRRLMG